MGQGGGVAEEGEFIEVVEMGVEEVRIPTKALYRIFDYRVSNINYRTTLIDSYN